jgi:hypothetical protein
VEQEQLLSTLPMMVDLQVIQAPRLMMVVELVQLHLPQHLMEVRQDLLHSILELMVDQLQGDFK